MCCYDAAWKKPTHFETNLPNADFVGRRCPGHVARVILQGTVKGMFGTRWRTSFAAAYPPGLCRAWARCAVLAAPPGARPGRRTRLDPWWEQRLADAVDSLIEHPLVLEHLAAKPQLGWEHATGFWCGLPWRAELRILDDIRRFNKLRSAQAVRATRPKGLRARRLRGVPAPEPRDGNHSEEVPDRLAEVPELGRKIALRTGHS